MQFKKFITSKQYLTLTKALVFEVMLCCCHKVDKVESHGGNELGLTEIHFSGRFGNGENDFGHKIFKICIKVVFLRF